MFSFLVGEEVRDLRRAGRVGLSAVLLITLSLAALGAFWLVSINLERAVTQWRERLRVVAYLRDEPRPEAVAELVRKVQAVGGIQRVRYVSRSEALESLKRALGAQSSVVDQLPRNPLPASVEVTPDVTTATPLVLHARRDEMEIMRLVGATERVIRLPLLLQGMVQGLLGALIALGGLEAAHALLAPRLEPLLTLTLGLSRAAFLSAPEMLLLLGGGAG